MTSNMDDTNLAHIGSAEDLALKKAAAETEVQWDGAGNEVGIKIWRVENIRDEHGHPKFGIQVWPKERYGEFYSGDSYIVLETTQLEQGSDKFQYDIYFWIGSESSQDEYGVAAYKAAELDSLLDDVPIQHREVQYYESDAFLNCFSKYIKYLDGGIDGGFRKVKEGDQESLPVRLYRIQKDGKVTRCFHVLANISSLNHGDCFVLDAGKTIYTWFGDHASPFEKNKAGEIAHNLQFHRHGDAVLIEEVGDDNDDFWSFLGGRGDIQSNGKYEARSMPIVEETKMSILSDVDSFLKITDCEVLQSNLESGDVCLIDTGRIVYVWIGKQSSLREQNQAVIYAEKYLKGLSRDAWTQIIRVLEGQESRVSGFLEVF